MIGPNSRYSDSLLVTEEQPDGNDVIVITPSDATAYTFNYSLYIVNVSDRIDTLANAFLGDSTKWWLIADANPEVMNWFNLSPGTVIRIPVAY
jgi:hypothetical protein